MNHELKELKREVNRAVDHIAAIETLLVKKNIVTNDDIWKALYEVRENPLKKIGDILAESSLKGALHYED